MARKTKYSVVDDELIDWIIKEEGFLDKPTDIGDGKVTIGSGLTDPKWIDKYKKKGYWSKEDNRKAVAEELQKRSEWAEDTLPNWGSLPANTKKAMLSYKYNYDFTRENSPKLFGAMESGNFIEAVRQMDATSKNPKFKKGLQDRRDREQQWGLQGLFEKPTLDSSYEYPDATTLVNPYTAKIQNITFTDQYVPTSPAYNLVEADKVSAEINEYDKVRRAIDAQAAYRRLIQDNAWENQEPKRYVPTSGINYVIDSYAEGGKLDRKKSWDELSMKEKADMIRVAVDNGITTLPEIREKYNEFAMGGDTEETYEGRQLPEVEVIAPRKWFVGYDENANPIYTTDYRQSQEYLQNQIPLSDIEQSRRQWAFKNKGANGQVRPGLHGDAADLDQAAQIGIGTALSPFAYKGITGLLANPVVDAALTVDGVINAPSRIKEGIGDINNGNYGSAAWNFGTTALDILGGSNLAKKTLSNMKNMKRFNVMRVNSPYSNLQVEPEETILPEEVSSAISKYADSQKNAVRQMNERMSNQEYASMIKGNSNPKYAVEGKPLYIEGKDSGTAKETSKFFMNEIQRVVENPFEQVPMSLDAMNAIYNNQAFALPYSRYAYLPKKDALLSGSYIRPKSSNALRQHQYSILKAHEGSHVYAHPGKESPLHPHLSGFNKNYFGDANGSELSARGTQLKNYFDKKTLTADELKYASKHYVEDTGIDNNMTEMFGQIKTAEKKNPNIWEDMAKWFSAVSPAVVIGSITKGNNE